MTRRHFGEFEQTLLYAVLFLQDDEEGACGPAIRKLLRAQTVRLSRPGRFTPPRVPRRTRVRDLELGEPTPERGGKRKRNYRLRAAGESALRAAEANLTKLARLARVQS